MQVSKLVCGIKMSNESMLQGKLGKIFKSKRVVVSMSTLDTNVDGSILSKICFLIEQETLSALLQSTQL